VAGSSWLRVETRGASPEYRVPGKHQSRPRGMMGNPLRQPLEIGEPQRLVRPSSIGPSNDANNNISKQNKVNDIFVFEGWILSMTSMPTLVSRQSRTW
jgi:hypothetical protein